MVGAFHGRPKGKKSQAENYFVPLRTPPPKETISQCQYLLGQSPGARTMVKTGPADQALGAGCTLTCQQSCRD